MLGATTAGWGSVYLGVLVLSPLLPTMLDELGITPAQAGVAMSALWAMSALGQYPGGHLSDGVGRRTVLVVGLGVGLLGNATVATTTGYAQFVAGAALVGLSSGLFPPAAIALASDLYDAGRGRALGLMLGGGDLSGAVAGLFVPALVATAAWRLTYVPVLVLLAASLVGVHAWSREPYRLAGATLPPVRATVARLLTDRRMLPAAVAFGLWMAVFQSTLSFLPTFLEAAKGLSPAVAGASFALWWLVGMVVKPSAGWFGDRFGYLRTITVLLLGSAVGLGALVLAGSLAATLAAVAATAATLLAITPLVYTYLTAVTADETTGGDVGALRTVFFGVGSLGPAAVGFVADLASFEAAFAGLLVLLLVSAAVLAVFVR